MRAPTLLLAALLAGTAMPQMAAAEMQTLRYSAPPMAAPPGANPYELRRKQIRTASPTAHAAPMQAAPIPKPPAPKAVARSSAPLRVAVPRLPKSFESAMPARAALPQRVLDVQMNPARPTSIERAALVNQQAEAPPAPRPLLEDAPPVAAAPEAAPAPPAYAAPAETPAPVQAAAPAFEPTAAASASVAEEKPATAPFAVEMAAAAPPAPIEQAALAEAAPVSETLPTAQDVAARGTQNPDEYASPLPSAPIEAAQPAPAGESAALEPPANETTRIITTPDPVKVVTRGETVTNIPDYDPAEHSMFAQALAELTPAAGETPLLEDASAASEPEPALSEESRRILSGIPGSLGAKPKPAGKESINVERRHPSAGEDAEISHEALGLKIDIRQPQFDSNYELEKAYAALIAGDTPSAIGIYELVLANQPDNVQALFGLATAYHRAGQLEKARPLYGRILKINPSHAGALNNFLVLIAEEAPQEALSQLEALQARNPGFSPIPAQIAVIQQKLGNLNAASEAMMEAINISPENLAYRHNLAVLLDMQGKRLEAAQLYQQLVAAHLKGENIANIRQIEERLTFLRSNL